MTTRTRSKLKRAAIALLVAFPAWAASGGGTFAVAQDSQPAGTQPATPPTGVAASSPEVAAELKQLQQSIEAQAQVVAEHSQELENERAALRQEMDRIAGLEAKLGITPAGASGARRARSPWRA